VLRPGIAILAVVSATLLSATPGISRADPAVSVSVKPSAPTAAAGRAPSGLRKYGVSFRVTITSTQECENLSVAYSYASRFDGRPSLGGSATDSYDTGAPATTATFDVHAAGHSADTVTFSGRGTCEQSDGTVVSASTPVVATVVVPPHSCAEGPLRVLGLRGLVTREDLVSPKTRVRVRLGHYLWGDYRVWLARGSQAAFGAGECHALRVVATGPGTLKPGMYSAGSYGAPTVLGEGGGSVDFRGDQHSGGILTESAVVVPRGLSTAPSKLARFRVVSLARKVGRTTTVRVLRGTVYVAGRVGKARYGTPVLAHTGQIIVVRCSSLTACKAS
jgi:hypothetical protein